MYKYIRSAVLLVFAGCATQLSAQNFSESLMYSFYDYVGTARTSGVSGAFGALGGDQGAMYYNPSTLAMFRKSEIVITPTVNNNVSLASYNNSTPYNRSKNQFSVANVGAVFVSRPKSRNWETVNFAVGYNREANLGRNMKFDGEGAGSIVERFAERAHEKTLNELDPFEAGLAYDANALFDSDNDKIYEFDAQPGQVFRKAQTVKMNGRINTFNFAVAGNYQDKFQIGGRLSFPTVNMEVSKDYKELPKNNSTPFRALNYKEFSTTKGTGANLSLGFVYTGLKYLRVGAAFKSATNYIFEDKYNAKLDYTYADNQGVNQSTFKESPSGEFKYEYYTPWKATGSAAFLLRSSKLNGFISCDVDYIDYRSSRYDLTEYSQSKADLLLQEDLNQKIERELQAAMNYRFGAELAYDVYRLRAGLNLTGSPYSKDKLKTFMGYSGGVGLRFDHFFMDLAYTSQSSKSGYLPYQSLNKDNVPLVQLENQNHLVSASFGFKF